MIDDQLTTFLTKNQRILDTDTVTVVESGEMPGTTLTVREDAELKRLQRYEHPSLFEDGLSLFDDGFSEG